MLTRLRIWLPDDPGVLGAVAAQIGATGGNVVGLEVLERGDGVAVDEFTVELADDDGVVDAVCRAVRTVLGAGVEEVKVVPALAPDREDAVVNATVAIVQAATVTAALNALMGQLRQLFDLSWLALADFSLDVFVETHGDVPPIQWVAAFTSGARSGDDPARATTGSGVFAEEMPETGLTVCGGRDLAIRHRERHQIAMLVRVTERFIDALRRSAHAL